MRQLLVIILVLSSRAVLALDATCPKGFPRHMKAEGVSVEWHSHGDLQRFANIFVLPVYEGRELYGVTLGVGDHEFDDDGEEIRAPVIEASLKVHEFKGKPMVQVFVSNETPQSKLIIQYGELCGYSMNYEITHNNQIQPTPKSGAAD